MLRFLYNHIVKCSPWCLVFDPMDQAYQGMRGCL